MFMLSTFFTLVQKRTTIVSIFLLLRFIYTVKRRTLFNYKFV